MDGKRVYTANANSNLKPWTLPNGNIVTTGIWSGLNAATGAVLWQTASGGSCLSGAAISKGTIVWGSGYTNFGLGTPNNKLYAFELP